MGNLGKPRKLKRNPQFPRRSSSVFRAEETSSDFPQFPGGTSSVWRSEETSSDFPRFAGGTSSVRRSEETSSVSSAPVLGGPQPLGGEDVRVLTSSVFPRLGRVLPRFALGTTG